jgi:AraC family transcriptional regulator
VAESTYLLETRRLVVGEFRCPPDDPAWHETNYIGDEPHVVFPLTPVVIDQLDKGSVLTTPNHTVFYDGGQLYRRSLESEEGDHCFFIRLQPGTFGRMAENGVRTIHAPSDRSAFLERHLLVRELRTGAITAAAAEDRALRLVEDALRRQARAHGPSRERTVAAHRDLAEAAKALIARSFPSGIPLRRLATRLRTSPFHLARVFRAQTGFSVQGYQRSLRLRDALERLPTYADGLTTLALELGFSSHSHFTETFRREFGIAPSALR